MTTPAGTHTLCALDRLRSMGRRASLTLARDDTLEFYGFAIFHAPLRKPSPVMSPGLWSFFQV